MSFSRMGLKMEWGRSGTSIWSGRDLVEAHEYHLYTFLTWKTATFSLFGSLYEFGGFNYPVWVFRPQFLCGAAWHPESTCWALSMWEVLHTCWSTKCPWFEQFRSRCHTRGTFPMLGLTSNYLSTLSRYSARLNLHTSTHPHEASWSHKPTLTEPILAPRFQSSHAGMHDVFVFARVRTSHVRDMHVLVQARL